LEEQRRIHKIILNIDFDNIDERSDLISKIKSDNFLCPSPSRLHKKATVQSSHIEVIQEHKEDDDLKEINQAIEK
jgi:hypothetical protein